MASLLLGELACDDGFLVAFLLLLAFGAARLESCPRLALHLTVSPLPPFLLRSPSLFLPFPPFFPLSLPFFPQAAKLFGHSNVHDIAKYVETRTVAQVRTHTQKYFVKLEKTGAKPVSQEDVQGCSQPQEPGSIAIKCSEVEGVSAADL